jgi:hypothetical protein
LQRSHLSEGCVARLRERGDLGLERRVLRLKAPDLPICRGERGLRLVPEGRHVAELLLQLAVGLGQLRDARVGLLVAAV